MVLKYKIDDELVRKLALCNPTVFPVHQTHNNSLVSTKRGGCWLIVGWYDEEDSVGFDFFDSTHSIVRWDGRVHELVTDCERRVIMIAAVRIAAAVDVVVVVTGGVIWKIKLVH